MEDTNYLKTFMRIERGPRARALNKRRKISGDYANERIVI